MESNEFKVLSHPHDEEGNPILFDTETNDIFQVLAE